MLRRVVIVVGLGVLGVIPQGCRFDRTGVELGSDGAGDNANDNNTNNNTNTNDNANTNNNTNANNNTNNNSNPNTEICDNQIDDDLDSLTDCDDPECDGQPACQTEICEIAGDEDNNGLADCDDPVCLNTPTCGDCNPITNIGCTSGYCFVDAGRDWYGTCVPEEGDGGQWDWCASNDDCRFGFYCSYTYGECLQVCHPGSNECSAIPGTSCEDFSFLGSDSPWGLCR